MISLGQFKTITINAVAQHHGLSVSSLKKWKVSRPLRCQYLEASMLVDTHEVVTSEILTAILTDKCLSLNALPELLGLTISIGELHEVLQENSRTIQRWWHDKRKHVIDLIIGAMVTKTIEENGVLRHAFTINTSYTVATSLAIKADIQTKLVNSIATSWRVL